MFVPPPLLEGPEEGWGRRHRDPLVIVGLGLAGILFVLAIASVGNHVSWLHQPHRVAKVLLGAAAVFAFLLRPFLALAFLPLAFVYHQWLPISPVPALNATNLLAAALLYGWIGNAVVRRERMHEASPLDTPILLLLGWTTFAWLRAQLLDGRGIAGLPASLPNLWGPLCGLVIFFPLRNSVRTWKQVRWLTVAFCLGSALGVFGILRVAAAYGWRQGVGGGTGQVNVAAAYYASATIFCVGMLSGRLENLRLRLVLLASLVGCAVALIVSGSRGAYAGFLAGATPLAARAGVIWVVLIGLLVGSFFLWAPDYVRDRVLEVEDAASAEGERFDALNQVGGGRLEVWKASLKVIAGAPILGVGFGRMANVLEPYMGQPFPPHNVYLETAGELGFPGLILLLWIFLASFRAGSALLRYPGFPRALGLALQSAVLVLMVANLFGGRFYAFNMAGMLCLLSALALRARSLLEQEAPGSAHEVPGADPSAAAAAGRRG